MVQWHQIYLCYGHCNALQMDNTNWLISDCIFYYNPTVLILSVCLEMYVFLFTSAFILTSISVCMVVWSLSTRV